MGNNPIRPIARFLQSPHDFPVTVQLGKKTPAWGLGRWRNRGPSVGELVIAPVDEEGFAVRGNRNQVLYRGRKQSHRFTLLGNNSFEYDCILHKEPSSNVLRYIIEGAEHYEFYRQPEWVRNPLIAGSYAVYKKNITVGQGTGKLCHMYRPKIFDKAGRRVWGSLCIQGNELAIRIPQKWLATARYPVTVDPIIGTQAIGSMVSDEIENCELTLVQELAVNQFVIPEKISGTATAYYYAGSDRANFNYSPRLYDDVNGRPLTRRSKNEEDVNIAQYYRVSSSSPWMPVDTFPFWASASFECIGELEAGSTVWFGGYGESLFPFYDYGGLLYRNWPDMFWEQDEEEYYDEEEGEWLWTEPIGYELPDFPDGGESANFIVSWYFEYESAYKNYLRTLTQGITLSDSESHKGAYQRKSVHTANILDLPLSLLAKMRKLLETAAVGDSIGGIGWYFRELYSKAGSLALSISQAAYHRFNQDSVSASGAALRHFLIFVKLVTVGFVRDYIINRFLRSKEDSTVKSPVCREVIIESRMH